MRERARWWLGYLASAGAASLCGLVEQRGSGQRGGNGQPATRSRGRVPLTPVSRTARRCLFRKTVRSYLGKLPIVSHVPVHVLLEGGIPA